MAHWTLRSIVNWTLGGVLAAATAVVFLPYALATREMRAFCTGLAPGTTATVIAADAASRGYAFLPGAGGSARVHDPASFGRRNCLLRFDARGLRTAEYSSGG